MGAGDTFEFELSPSAFVFNGREMIDTGFLLTRYVVLGSFKVGKSGQLAGDIRFVGQAEQLEGSNSEVIGVGRPVGSGRFADRAGFGSVLGSSEPVFYYETNITPEGIAARRAEGDVANESKAPLGPLGFSGFFVDRWWDNFFDSNLV